MGISYNTCCFSNYTEKQDLATQKPNTVESVKESKTKNNNSPNTMKENRKNSFQIQDIDITTNIEKTKEYEVQLKDEEEISFSTFKIKSLRNINFDEQLSNTEIKIKSTKLILKTIHNKNSLNSIELEISTQGLKNSVRNKNDGFTYFGLKNDDPENINDYLIQADGLTKEEKEKAQGRHFCIYYNPQFCKYIIKDMGKGFGAYLKINDNYYLKDKTMIYIGNSFILVKFNDDNNLMLEIYKKDSHKCEKLLYKNKKDYYHIGRGVESDVYVDDKLLSRFHCFIKYDDKNGWLINDGYISNENGTEVLKNSTNGTWIYISEEMEVTNLMIIKSIKTVYQCILLNSC